MICSKTHTNHCSITSNKGNCARVYASLHYERQDSFRIPYAAIRGFWNWYHLLIHKGWLPWNVWRISSQVACISCVIMRSNEGLVMLYTGVLGNASKGELLGKDELQSKGESCAATELRRVWRSCRAKASVAQLPSKDK